ncbi:MAG: 16S rRNA (uracil(1498)-N(3))-methyltransferase [Rhodothermaceae bacterium]|nr:16S rRNA (uracil(1498)-N(3))-methyltransferase [Rhodothermaceae bacterium]MXZ57189.1 16S rRNA (uracil(1498)-N(3))-methyltransferase [Rhodothermaceae bacterium]MYB90887.1 16S rRNA (uracil(1498)-N(3))-methyltransferase [Rhodothermaceae bacterium]MYD67761.1 16S rRNA (uracil(1498)-N(3))-methyltransferase [Rhodothermaceae bacterium]MYG45056.1 16S rRNA (uracil(1498)-N(3))-methyltransferase [Rhodothermaceae bacterium]
MDRFFFAPPEAFSPTGHVVLPSDEAKHVVKVLRLRPGTIITVVDGQGYAARVQIEQADRQGVHGHVISEHKNLGEPVHELTVGLALLKQQKRYNLFLEKAVELGVTGIIPLLTERTESRNWREDRARQVMTAALKQCNRSRLPDLHPPTSLHQLLGPGILVADPNTDTALMAAIHQGEGPVRILIGPEGGFAEHERRLAVDRGAVLVRLGPRRLRAETAAICCAAAVVLAGQSGT